MKEINKLIDREIERHAITDLLRGRSKVTLNRWQKLHRKKRLRKQLRRRVRKAYKDDTGFEVGEAGAPIDIVKWILKNWQTIAKIIALLFMLEEGD